MDINKPCIGPVALESASWTFKKKYRNISFIVTNLHHVKYYRWRLYGQCYDSSLCSVTLCPRTNLLNLVVKTKSNLSAKRLFFPVFFINDPEKNVKMNSRRCRKLLATRGVCHLLRTKLVVIALWVQRIVKVVWGLKKGNGVRLATCYSVLKQVHNILVLLKTHLNSFSHLVTCTHYQREGYTTAAKCYNAKSIYCYLQ